MAQSPNMLELQALVGEAEQAANKLKQQAIRAQRAARRHEALVAALQDIKVQVVLFLLAGVIAASVAVSLASGLAGGIGVLSAGLFVLGFIRFLQGVDFSD